MDMDGFVGSDAVVEARRDLVVDRGQQQVKAREEGQRREPEHPEIPMGESDGDPGQAGLRGLSGGHVRTPCYRVSRRSGEET